MRTALLAAAATMVTGAASAQTTSTTPSLIPNEGWYIGGGVGWDSNGRRSLLGDGKPDIVKFKDGVGVLAEGGYKWSQGFRTELEVSYREGKLKDLNSSATPLTGTQHDTSAMANVLLDIHTGTKWTPYVGVGGGITWLNWGHVQSPPSPELFVGTNDKFAWQGIAGVALAVAPKLEVTLDFRYKGVNNNHYSGTSGDTITNYDARTRTVMLGVRYTFGNPAVASAPPPPPPPPAPMAAAPAPRPAPPAQPPAEQKFLVFFDFDKSNLRADAMKIVTEAADYAKKNGKAHIVATGHTDTAGTAPYNMALSERRAKAVEKELERLGIPASEVTVLWKGKSEPLVQTGDGVKEPQNRRVEIVLE